MRVASGITLSEPSDVVRTDAELLARYAAGNAEGLGELFDRHHRATYRFLARLTSARQADLDDLVQTTFVEVARSARRFDGRSAVTTWLFGIAVNVARHHRRSATRLARVIELPRGDHLPEAPSLDRPDEKAERREILSRVARAIEDLPNDLREAFVACDVEDLPGVEVAKLFGIPEGTLYRRVHDARRRVRKAVLGDET